MLLSKEDINLLDLFFEMMRAERGISANTLSAYRTDLLAFAQFLKRPLLTLSTAEIEAYITHLKDAKNSTVARKLSSLRQFYCFLLHDGYRSDDPTRAIVAPKTTRPLPKYLSQDEILAIFNTLKGEDPESIRLLALFELLYASGLRISELVTLPLSSFAYREASSRFFHIKGKGGKERLVPMHDLCLGAIEKYIHFRPYFLDKVHTQKQKKAVLYLFPANSHTGHMTRQRVSVFLKDLALQTGIDPARISPHVIRHAFATHMLQNGADILTIQKLLGHADIATTQIYTHVIGNHVTRLLEQHHPLSQKIVKINSSEST